MQQKEMVAMLLAGGQGSRLGRLTAHTAKPALTFGGKYRLIDFPLSACAHSGVDTVGILTQYQPQALCEYIGDGGAWGLDGRLGGVHILPPYQRSGRSDWYRGTANAVYQNLAFLDRFAPAYVLILAGDHICRMDYAAMLRRHRESGADCTVAAIRVAPEEASRFGIIEAGEDGHIRGFEEKPQAPRSELASMGVYIFTASALRRALIEDERDASSSGDFGKNVIPRLLAQGARLFFYLYEGYWRDVGTLSSLWQANMDLLGPAPRFRLDDPQHPIYSQTRARAPQFIGSGATVRNSCIADGCHVFGRVENSVLSCGVTVEAGALVRDTVLFEGVRVCAGCELHGCIVDSGTVVRESVFRTEGRGRPRVTLLPSEHTPPVISLKSKEVAVS